VAGGIRRVMNRPAHIIGRSTQVLPNNWKLYFENTKDTYHASILHAFLTTFRINRLTRRRHQHRRERRQPFQLCQARLRGRGRRVQGGGAALRHRPQARGQFADWIGRRVWRHISVQILTVFPNLVVQQIRNTIAVRVIRPRGVERTELEWVHLGFEGDDEAMTERRLPPGQSGRPSRLHLARRRLRRRLCCNARCKYNDDDSGVVMMGGHDAESQAFRASEAAIRGFWKKYRALTGT